MDGTEQAVGPLLTQPDTSGGDTGSVLNPADIATIAVYFVVVIGVGIGTSCRAETDTSEGYFLAGRSMHWIPIGASTFATNIGAPMFIGIAGSAAKSGIAVIMFEWHAMWMLLLLGWLFLPVYMSSGCYTMPQYLKLRYGGQRIRVWLSVVSIILTIISSIAGQMYAGALFIQLIFGWNLYASVALILAITAVYTILGGLTAVIWTDTIQTVILIIGSFVMAIMGLVKIGGFEPLRNQYVMTSSSETILDVALHGNRTCGLPRADSFNIFRATDADYPWPGLTLGLTILATNAWCTDQLCVQRSLSAKSYSHAKAGTLMAAYLKFLPFVFFVIPGFLSRVMFPEEIACADPDKCQQICGNRNGCSDIAYPLLVIRELPPGVKGLMLAALLSALMSSLTSVFNSSSTVFTMDLWRRCRPRAKESELMVVSRVWTLVLVVVSVAWLPILERVRGSMFWEYSQSISSYILPPIVTVFLLGLFWTRTTEAGAFTGLVLGLVIGVIRMGITWARSAPPCGSGAPDSRFDVIARVHYMHFACILLVIVAFIVVCVSLVTKPRPPQKLRRVTFWTRLDPELPELSDDEEEEEEEKEEENTPPDDKTLTRGQRANFLCLKWWCGVDRLSKRKKLTREEHLALMLKMTNITEKPSSKRWLDMNALVCAALAVFIHAFWA